MFCIYCGAELPGDVNFCIKCGKPQKSGLQVDAADRGERENKVQPGEQRDEKTSFEVCLLAVGPNKINVIKALQKTTSWGLKECKDFVESAPVSMHGLSREEAESIQSGMASAGADAEVR